MTRTVLAILGALLVAGPGAAQKPRVQVVFDVAEPDYVDLFQPSALDSLEQEAAVLIADTLVGRLPVLDLTTDSADFRLIITVDRQDTTEVSTLQLDRGLFARLVGPDSSTALAWWTLFRRGGGTGTGLVITGVPVRRTFLQQLQLALARADFDNLVEAHLSRVPIAKQARPLEARPPHGFGWVAPIVRDSLCLARGNPLRVLVVFPNPLDTVPENRLFLARLVSDFSAQHFFGGQTPSEWQGLTRGVFAEPEPANQEDLPFVRQDSTVTVAGVFLLRYDEAGRELCRRLPTPDEAEAGQGGGP